MVFWAYSGTGKFGICPTPGLQVKVAARSDRTHNPFGEAHGVSGLRENLTSRSDGEGLETGPRDSLRHRQEAKAAGQQLIPAPYRHRASPLPDNAPSAGLENTVG